MISYALRKDDIKTVIFDYVAVVYDRVSGITHVLMEPIPQIMEVLEEKPLTAEQVKLQIISKFDVQTYSDEDSAGHIEDIDDIVAARINELVMLGLVIEAKIISDTMHRIS